MSGLEGRILALYKELEEEKRLADKRAKQLYLAGAGVASFIGHDDTPATYAGQAGKFVKVNATPDALVFTDIAWADVSKTGSNLTDLATRQHAGLTNITSDQHHAQAHTLASHSSKAHSELTGVSVNQHHAQLHAASHNLAGGDELNHDNLAGFVTAEHLSLPNTIANVLSDHDKAVHDALNIDADTLDSYDSGYFAVATHLHDDRYYTEGEIDTFLAAQNEFTELTDTPASYSGQGGKNVRVNVAENSLEFVDPGAPGAHAATHEVGGGDVLNLASMVGATVKLTGLTDGYIPYHVNDATGLANSPIRISGANVGIGTIPTDKLDVAGAIRVTSNIAWDAGKPGRIYKAASAGLALIGITGSTYDMVLANPAGYTLLANPTGTNTVELGGNLTMPSATSKITGGTKLWLEAGVDGIGSVTIKDDTTASAANVYITDTATAHLFRSTSAKRYKDRIKDLEIDSSLIYKLRAVSFNSKSKGDDKNRRFIGLIANEIEQIYPEIINYNENNEAESYDNQMLMTLILAETQRHEARIAALEAQLNT